MEYASERCVLFFFFGLPHDGAKFAVRRGLSGKCAPKSDFAYNLSKKGERAKTGRFRGKTERLFCQAFCPRFFKI